YPDIQPVPEQTGDGFFGRAYVFDNENVAMIIKQSKAGASLRVSHSETNIPRNQLRMLVRRTLGQGISFDEALSQMKRDPVIARLVPGVSGVRPYMSPTPFEALIKTIIQQQISYRAANMFTSRMVVGLSTPLSHEGQSWFHFPDAITISKKGSDGLKEYGFGYKSEYIHGVASLVAEGGLDLDSLIGNSQEQVMTTLKPIRGIGEWTVKVLSIAGLGDFSVFAYSDLVIQKILGNLYNDGRRMTAKQVQDRAMTWGDEGTKVLYLLMSAEVLGLIDSAEKP
ncbi:MAG: DNA-3-methyladenine glycosylase family protein, partial [Candidatus Thorarchaeota archaeon]